MNNPTHKEFQALRHIRNSILHRGRTPSVRQLMKALGYKSPRSAQDILNGLVLKGFVRKFDSGDYQLLGDSHRGQAHAQTLDVPIVGTIAAGVPILAEENVEGFIPISMSLLRSDHKYFLLRVRGDSMNKAGIDDGDFVLVRQQSTADPGQQVVALINDEATVKTYHPGRDVIVLKPDSTNPVHQPIVVDHDFHIQGVIVKSIGRI